MTLPPRLPLRRGRLGEELRLSGNLPARQEPACRSLLAGGWAVRLGGSPSRIILTLLFSVGGSDGQQAVGE